MKKQWTCLLAAALCLGTTACGGLSAGGASGNKTVLKVHTLDGGVGQTWLKDLEAQFEAAYLGFVPNANNILDRSQPPFFIRGVYDLYQYTKDEGVIARYAEAMQSELDFFRLERSTPCGLAQYKTSMPKNLLLPCYDWLSVRVGEYRETESEKLDLCYNLLSIAESGWDFNPRFQTENSPFEISAFACLDLNCILYDAERKAAELFSVVGKTEIAAELNGRAEGRKTLILRYMSGNDGVFRDYNFKTDSLSKVVSAAALYPYAFGIAEDKEGLLKAIEVLQLPYGVAACEFRGEDATYYQWDYPSVWPTNVYMQYFALKNVGLDAQAEDVAKRYIGLVDKCFAETGALWEKYDGVKGEVSVTNEYATPEMMGWTAGIYAYFTALLQA